MYHLRSFGASQWWKLLLASVSVAIVWLFLWYFPWQDQPHHNYWLQLGVGLVIFIIPGLCVYGLLSDSPSPDFRYITFGFVISHLIFALLGLFGRFTHLPFEAISLPMMALGLVLLLIFLVPKVNHKVKFRMGREQTTYLLSTWPILLMVFLVFPIIIQRVISSDDLTYLAFVTNWQHSTRLDFNDLIFGEPQWTSIRFWMMSAPFAQAFLAEISRMPGILVLGGYYEPFLVVISVLCWYELAMALDLSPKASSISVILELSCLLLLSEYLHAGYPFFTQLSSDKATAAFIIAPVFFQALLKLLKIPTQKNMILLLLTGLSLGLMHPIILAYSIFIGFVFVLLNKNSEGGGSKWIPLIILAVILVPQVAIRFAEVPMTAGVTFDPEVVLTRSDTDNLVTHWEDTPFYGFNVNTLTAEFPYEESIPLPETALRWGWLLVPIISVFIAIQQRDGKIAQFILACFALCFLTALPLTGWMFGYFLNARMLARSVWLFPFGLSATYVILTIRDHLVAKHIIRTHPTRGFFAVSNWAIAALTLTAIGLFLLYMRANNLPDNEKFVNKTQRYQGLAMAGQALDRQIADQAYVMGSTDINDLIPGLSWKSKLITFRFSNPSNMVYFTPAEREERIVDTEAIFSKSITAAEKLTLFKKYNIQFLLLQRDDIRLFKNLLETYPDRFKITEIGGVIILEIE